MSQLGKAASNTTGTTRRSSGPANDKYTFVGNNNSSSNKATFFHDSPTQTTTTATTTTTTTTTTETTGRKSLNSADHRQDSLKSSANNAAASASSAASDGAKLARKTRTSASGQSSSSGWQANRTTSGDSRKKHSNSLEQAHVSGGAEVASSKPTARYQALSGGSSATTATTASVGDSAAAKGASSSGSALTTGGSLPVQASTTQRLSSIDILNENRQRQLQFKQQESFKQHLEQRQRQLIQQQQLEAAAGSSPGSQGSSSSQADAASHNDLRLTYQVNTSAPEYVVMAAAAAAAAEAAASGKGGRVRGNIAVNPFNDSSALEQRPSPQPRATGGPASSQVSGKSGFLSALLDEASFETTSGETRRADESDEELNSGGGPSGRKRTAATTSSQVAGGSKPPTATRYSKVAEAGQLSYNYDDEPDKRPFYQRDLSSLLTELRASRKLVILIVAIALLLDNMLLTSVVPIIPAHLYKLRIERQHRDQLQRNQTASTISSANKQQLTGTDTDADGQQDDGDFEEELQRRINQSLASAKDRYSGSVFHPRVRIKPASSFSGDNDELTSGRSNDKYRGGGKFRDNVDVDDNNDDDAGRRDKSNEAADREPDEEEAEDEMQVENNERSAGSGRLPSDQQRKQMSSQTKEWRSRRPPGGASGAGKNDMDGESGTVDENNNSDTDGDDDDQDANNAKRWLSLQSSLVRLAKSSGNDTEALANMCLTRVLGKPQAGRKSPFDSDEEERTGGVGRKQRPAAKASRRPTRAARSKVIRTRPTTSTTTTTSPTTTESGIPVDEDGELIISHQDIVDESFEVGVMFASKPIVQAFANPFIGTLTNKVGFTIPMFTGFVIMFLSTLVFAFGNSYSTLFIARAIQGVGSACTSVAGMSMLADRFPDDAERGNAMAIALGGLALGVVIGPPFGGFMYQFVGKSSPFIVLAILALLDGLLQLAVLQPRVTKSQEEGASLLTLIKDPYILVAAGAITFANTGIAILEPALPLWMMDTMQAKNWEQGVAFLPAALSYMFGTNLFGNLGHKIGRWRATMIGLVIIGCSLLLIPFATRVDHLIIPNGAIGFAMGMVDSTMMPMLGYLVDIRHTSVYGSVYAIGDVAFCASFAFGPALSGTLVELIGFEGLIITTAFICFCFAPLLFLLRDPPARQVDESQVAAQSLRYVNYNQLDSPDEETAQLTEYRSTGKTYVK